MPDDPKRDISPERKNLYYAGMACTVIGFLLFLSVFVTHIANFGNFYDFEGRARSAGFRAAGGMANDALVEVELAKKLGKKLDEPPPAGTVGPPPAPVVKVRCRACSALNDEHAKFCNQCAAAL